MWLVRLKYQSTMQGTKVSTLWSIVSYLWPIPLPPMTRNERMILVRCRQSTKQSIFKISRSSSSILPKQPCLSPSFFFASYRKYHFFLLPISGQSILNLSYLFWLHLWRTYRNVSVDFFVLWQHGIEF